MSVLIGSKWEKAGRAGRYEVDKISDTQARLRNMKTRRTEWVGLVKLQNEWTRMGHIPAPASTMGTPLSELLWCIPADMHDKARGHISALESEWRADEREKCAQEGNAEAATLMREATEAKRRGEDAKAAGIVFEATASARVAERIRNRK